MALNFVNSTLECPFRVEAYHGRSPNCDRVLLENILDPVEARQSRLDLITFKSCVSDILENRDDRLTIIAFLRQNNRPAALAAFKKNRYDVNMVDDLPGQTTRRNLLQVRRKTLWELQYVVRGAQFKSQCLGDIVLSCGLEKLGEICLSPESRVTTNVWLIVANSFLNSPAIRLYLSYGFQMSAMYQSTLMMVLFDLNHRRIEKARISMERQVESLFLLQQLKNNNPQPSCDSPSTSQTHQALQPLSCDQQIDEAATSDSSSNSSSQNSIEPTRKRRKNDSDGEASQEDSQKTKNLQDLSNDTLTSLQFISFSEHIKWAPSILTPIDAEMNVMIQHTRAMWQNAEATDERHSFLQHLQIAKQIEVFSKRIHRHTYDAIYDLHNHGIGLSIQYLRSILRVSWAVYKYPVFIQCKMPWKVGIKRIPEIAAMLDRITENYGRFPNNITAAQEDRHSLCIRLFLQYPERPLGDGDGLPYTTVLSTRGIFRNDALIGNLGESYESTSWYRRIQATVGTEVRSRIVGYDTQEVPRTNDERDVDMPQPFWEEGRTFLSEELHRLLGSIPPQSAVVLVDCFSVDLYDRLLIDIRGVYHVNQMAVANSPLPSLGRFELAHRALSTGYAFPTYNFLVNQALLAVFDTAREQQRGAFGSNLPIHHPSLCRQRRYEILKNQTRARRRRFHE